MANLILISLFPLIGLIAMGYILKHFQFLDAGFWKGAEKLNYYLLFPIMLFLNLAFAQIDPNAIQNLMLVATAVIAVGCIVLYLLRRMHNTPSARFGVYMQSIVRFNTYIGLAVVASLFKQQGMTLFAILLVFCIPLVNILSVLALTSSEQLNAKNVCIALAKNPLILGCIFGGLFNVLELSLWAGLENLLKQVALCSLPLGLMCVGAALQFSGFKRDLSPIFYNTLARMLGMPALAILFCHLLNIPKLETQIVVLFFALPTASASYVLTKVLGGDSRLMASIISIQTVCAALSLPFILWWVI